MRPTRIEYAIDACDIYYEYFYPGKSSSIAVYFLKSQDDGVQRIPVPSSNNPRLPTEGVLDIDISGVNIVVP